MSAVTASAEPTTLRFSGVSANTMVLRRSNGSATPEVDSIGRNFTTDVGMLLQASAAACKAAIEPAGAPSVLTKNRIASASVRCSGFPFDVLTGEYAIAADANTQASRRRITFASTRLAPEP